MSEKSKKEKGDKEKKDKGDKEKKEKKSKKDKDDGPLDEAKFPPTLKHGGAKYVRFILDDGSTPGYALESDQSNPARQWKAKFEATKEKLFFSNIADKTQRVWKLPGAEDLGVAPAASDGKDKKDKSKKEKKDKKNKTDSAGASRPDTPTASPRGGGADSDSDGDDGRAKTPTMNFGRDNDDDDDNGDDGNSAAERARQEQLQRERKEQEAEAARRRKADEDAAAEAEAERRRRAEQQQEEERAREREQERERQAALDREREWERQREAEAERQRQAEEAAKLVEQQRNESEAERIRQAELEFQRQREAELEKQREAERRAEADRERQEQLDAERERQAQREREQQEAENHRRRAQADAEAERERQREHDRQARAHAEAEKKRAEDEKEKQRQQQQQQQEEREESERRRAAQHHHHHLQQQQQPEHPHMTASSASRSSTHHHHPSDEHAAATKIQSIQRGRSVRKEFEQSRRDAASAAAAAGAQRQARIMDQEAATAKKREHQQPSSGSSVSFSSGAPGASSASTSSYSHHSAAAAAPSTVAASQQHHQPAAANSTTMMMTTTTTPAKVAARGLPIHMYSDEERDRLRDRLKLFFDTHAPAEAGNIGRLAMGSSSSNLTEEDLFAELASRYRVQEDDEVMMAAEQNLLPEQHRFGSLCRDLRGQERERLRSRLQLFFSTYFPGGVAKVEDALGLELCETAVFHTLCTKYDVDKAEEAALAAGRRVYPQGLPAPKKSSGASSRRRQQVGSSAFGNDNNNSSSGGGNAAGRRTPQEDDEESLRRRRAEAAADFAAAAAKHDVHPSLSNSSMYNSEVDAIVAPVSAIIEHSKYVTDMIERDKQRLLCSAVDTLMLDHAAAALAASKMYQDFVLRISDCAKREVASISPQRARSSTPVQNQQSQYASSPQQQAAMLHYQQHIQAAPPPGNGPVQPVQVQPQAAPVQAGGAPDFVMTSDAGRQQFSQQVRQQRGASGSPAPAHDQHQQQQLVPSYWRKILTPPSGHNPHAYQQLPPDAASAASQQQQHMYGGVSPPMHSGNNSNQFSSPQRSVMTINDASPIPLTSPGGFVGGPTAGAGMTAAAAAHLQHSNAHPPNAGADSNSPMTTFLQWDSRRSGAVLLSADRTSARMIPPYNTIEMDRTGAGGGVGDGISKHKYAPEFFLIGTIGIARGEFVFETTVELPEAAFSPDNFFAVGVASKYYRGPAGRKCMAYMLRSDGSLLTHSDSTVGISYAHALSRKAVVTVHLNLNRWEMAFYVDGVPLGVAFRFTPTHDPEPLFPVACFGPKGGMVELQRPTAATLPENVSPGRIQQWPELNDKGLPAAMASPGTPGSIF